jgi:hypothetical protein
LSLWKKRPKAKRRKTTINKRALKAEHPKAEPQSFVPLQPLLDIIEWQDAHQDEQSFEHLMNDLLPDYMEERRRLQDKETEPDLSVNFG